ncbi:MAG TPA: CsbD family protein [Candidatus Solibacter sp.]|nr:CsbD family protein [Candidatus Solibacter sp.]
MNKDRIKGKAKDIAGRIERQAEEWTGDPKKQVEGAAKQVEGKAQNAWGKAKDALGKDDSKQNPKPPRRSDEDVEEEEETRETGS